MGWDVDGVTGESRYIKLLYSEAAEVVLVQFERMVGEKQAVRSLYVRGRHETAYRKAFVGDDLTSARDVVCAPRSPIAVFSVWVATEQGGSNVTQIAKLDLRNGEVTKAI